jgi:hypothetical protein
VTNNFNTSYRTPVFRSYTLQYGKTIYGNR